MDRRVPKSGPDPFHHQRGGGGGQSIGAGSAGQRSVLTCALPEPGAGGAIGGGREASGTAAWRWSAPWISSSRSIRLRTSLRTRRAGCQEATIITSLNDHFMSSIHGQIFRVGAKSSLQHMGSPMESFITSSSAPCEPAARCIRARARISPRAACRSSKFAAFVARHPRPPAPRQLQPSVVFIFDGEITDSRSRCVRSRAGKHVTKTSTLEPRVGPNSLGGTSASDGPGALTPESTSPASSSWLEGNLYAPVPSTPLHTPLPCSPCSP